MDKYAKFKQAVADAAARFSELDKKETIRIVSHLDADGISACAILVRALNLLNRKYSVSIVSQLNEKIITELKEENHHYYFFTDLGSGQINMIMKHLGEKTIFILDHHELPEFNQLPENIVHINPHEFGIDGSKEVAGAGVVYMFGKSLTEKLDLAHIAIVGAPFGSNLAKEWIAVDQFGVKSTSIVTISPSAIVFYETPNAPGETILALPLEAGASWLRYGESSVDSEIGDSFGGLITNLNGKGDPADADSTVDGKSGDPIDAGKNFPIDGSESLIVDGFEKVLLSNGEAYSDAVKLRNGGLGGVNYYWFAPGTGLVKFVLRGQTDGSEVGATVGELISLTLQ